MNILAISGSLRSLSSNTILLHALALLLPERDTLTMYEGLGALPWFNPDLDIEGAPAHPAVADLRAHLRAADAVAICSPEYAQESLRETLTVMSARVVDAASVAVPLSGRRLDAGIAATPELATPLRQAIEELRQSLAPVQQTNQTSRTS